MVLFIYFWEGYEFVHVGVEVLELGVVAKVYALERIVIEVEPFDAGQ